MTLVSIEKQIVIEYGAVVGFIKNHIYLSIAIGVGVGFLLGKIF